MKPLGKKNQTNDISKMLEQAQQMQQSLLQIQEQLAEQEIEGSAGGGAVKISMTGKHVVTSVKLDKEAIDADDLEMLEDMLLTAFNDALDKANKHTEEQMKSVTGGLNIPGLDSMF